MVSPIEQRYIDLHPGSLERHARARDIFPDGVTHDGRRMSPFPIYATHGIGPHKWDVDGNRIIDYWTGHGSMILGHSHPEVVAAVASQMAKGTHLSASSDLEIKWGQQVQQLIPSAEKVRFHSSGTEATMMAIRMARAYTGKSKVIKFVEHFHGWSDYLSVGSAGVGGIPQETKDTMIVLPPNDIGIVEKTLQDNPDVAAIILEPTGAHMGQIPVLPSFLGELRELTERTGVVLIFDEVVTGFRISKGGAQAYYGVTPDMTTMAKILGGGLPGGAVAGKADIINMIQARGRRGLRPEPPRRPQRHLQRQSAVGSGRHRRARPDYEHRRHRDRQRHGRAPQGRPERPSDAHGDTRLRQRHSVANLPAAGRGPRNDARTGGAGARRPPRRPVCAVHAQQRRSRHHAGSS